MLANEDHQLLPTLKRHHDLCAKLLDCSRQQMALIVEEDYTELLSVISRKQRLIEEWDNLKQQHPRLVETWNLHRAHLPETDRAVCEGLIRGIQNLYETLLREEQESTNALSLRRDATQRQLQNISQGAQTHEAYRDHLAPATHRHLDVGQ